METMIVTGFGVEQFAAQQAAGSTFGAALRPRERFAENPTPATPDLDATLTRTS